MATKTAHATRKSANCYDVTYSDTKAFDRDATWAYIKDLTRIGYVVEIDYLDSPSKDKEILKPEQTA